MTRKNIEKAYKFKCIQVKQGFGTFYACSIKAKELLEICEPIRAEVLDEEIDNDPLDISLNKSKGTQRKLGNKRPEQIAEYISSGMAAFPNSIIIGANISKEGYLLDDDNEEWELKKDPIKIIDKDDKKWEIEDDHIYINKGSLTAAIIDGQHRLAGFELLAKDHPSLEDYLLCSIYIDIPMTYHAQIFSTINSTQRKVNKNLIYQLYQIDMDEKNPEYWSPEVLSVYLSRALGVDEKSPLQNRVVLAVLKDDQAKIKDWKVSLSSLVESILKLISSQPREDRDAFYSKRMEEKERNCLEIDKSPWRNRYIKMNDKFIYNSVLSYLDKCYSNVDENSPYKSSIGCAALLEALKELLLKDELDFNSIESDLIECFKTIDQTKIPAEKTTKNKSLLRDVVIVSFMRKFDDIKHKFHQKTKEDYDEYF